MSISKYEWFYCLITVGCIILAIIDFAVDLPSIWHIVFKFRYLVYILLPIPRKKQKTKECPEDDMADKLEDPARPEDGSVDNQ